MSHESVLCTSMSSERPISIKRQSIFRALFSLALHLFLLLLAQCSRCCRSFVPRPPPVSGRKALSVWPALPVWLYLSLSLSLFANLLPFTLSLYLKLPRTSEAQKTIPRAMQNPAASRCGRKQTWASKRSPKNGRRMGLSFKNLLLALACPLSGPRPEDRISGLVWPSAGLFFCPSRGGRIWRRSAPS